MAPLEPPIGVSKKISGMALVRTATRCYMEEIDEKPCPNTTRIETLPVEIIQEVLGYLDDYNDLLNIILASRYLHHIFKGDCLRIQKQVTLNSINPDLLNTAIATICVRRDRPPCQRLHIHPSSISAHPFPDNPRGMSELHFLYRTVQKVADKFVAKSLLDNHEEMPSNDPLRPSVGLPLTREERSGLEWALLRYEVMARAIGRPVSQDSPLLPYHKQRALFSAMSVLELQQLFTLHAWMLNEYRQWNHEFIQSFVDEIMQAAEKAAPVRHATVSTLEVNVGVNPIMVHARTALGRAELQRGIPYLCREQQRRGGRWESDRLLSRLQGLGLRFFLKMCEKTPAQRHAAMLYAHRNLDCLQSDFLLSGFRHRRRRAGSTTNLLCNYMRLQHGPLPNTFVEQYIMMLDENRHIMRKEAGYFLLQTGWWFWGDARLKAMGFEKYPTFDEERSTDEQLDSLATWAVTYRASRYAKPLFPRDAIGADVELPFKAWDEIVIKYRTLGHPHH
ncbi:hypothetical protein GGS20DRAFT_310639 [Poronia punctata]|nr:hypothetical protein GGS20DRAFT_310639 [Poronia punctata]